MQLSTAGKLHLQPLHQSSQAHVVMHVIMQRGLLQKLKKSEAAAQSAMEQLIAEEEQQKAQAAAKKAKTIKTKAAKRRNPSAASD